MPAGRFSIRSRLIVARTTSRSYRVSSGPKHAGHTYATAVVSGRPHARHASPRKRWAVGSGRVGASMVMGSVLLPRLAGRGTGRAMRGRTGKKTGRPFLLRKGLDGS